MTFWVAGAVVVGGIASAAISSSGAQSAAQQQANAAENAAQVSQNEFNTITGQEQPFMQGGYGAMNALDYGLGIGGQQASYPSISAPNVNGYDPSSGFQINPGGGISRLLPGGGGSAPPPGPSAGTTPGGSSGMGYGSLLQPFTADYMKLYSPAYQFQLQQGQQGVLNADSSNAGALSGAARKDLIGYNQNMANTAFNNAFNQYQTQQGNIYQRLAGIAQLGQAAASNTGQQGTALAGQVAQSVQNVGTAQAAGTVGSANAWSGALSNMSYMPWLFANSSAASAGGGSTLGGFGG